MVSQIGPRVVRSNFARGQIYPGKERKRAKGPASVLWDQFLKFGPKIVNQATLTPMYSIVNCTSAA